MSERQDLPLSHLENLREKLSLYHVAMYPDVADLPQEWMLPGRIASGVTEDELMPPLGLDQAIKGLREAYGDAWGVIPMRRYSDLHASTRVRKFDIYADISDTDTMSHSVARKVTDPNEPSRTFTVHQGGKHDA
ncbi:MAG: hypothetical protein ABIQ64_03790 [Candidatus Saccharimonadales bacterium]